MKFFFLISRDKIENLKIPVGVFKIVFPQSPIFFSGNDHLLKTKGGREHIQKNIKNANNLSKF